MNRLAALLLMGALGSAPFALSAQVPASNAPLSFRVLDQDRLFRGSLLGQQVLERIRAAEAELAAENQTLFEQLAAEERALTEARATLSPEEFRARADAFDARVEVIRAERAERDRDLAARSDAMARAFFDAVLPVLTQLMAEESIGALLQPEVIILGPDWLDVTDLATQRLDAATAAGQVNLPAN